MARTALFHLHGCESGHARWIQRLTALLLTWGRCAGSLSAWPAGGRLAKGPASILRQGLLQPANAGPTRPPSSSHASMLACAWGDAACNAERAQGRVTSIVRLPLCGIGSTAVDAHETANSLCGAMENYEVIDTIGKGSFGTVCRIRRKSDGKVRAVPRDSGSRPRSACRSAAHDPAWGPAPPAAARLEGTFLWPHVREGEAAGGDRGAAAAPAVARSRIGASLRLSSRPGERPARAAPPLRRAVLRPHHRQADGEAVHHYGVLRGRRPRPAHQAPPPGRVRARSSPLQLPDEPFHSPALAPSSTQVEESEIWRYFAQIVLALKDCHRRQEKGCVRPIIHRDIKPGNIMLDRRNNVKVGDFGLSKELASRSKYAYTNVGTPFYMSPEMVNELRYNERSDIWAVGCLLYELAALRPPFEAHNQLSLAMKINSGKFPSLPSRYSEDLYRAIRWMLHTQVRAGTSCQAGPPNAALCLASLTLPPPAIQAAQCGRAGAPPAPPGPPRRLHAHRARLHLPRQQRVGGGWRRGAGQGGAEGGEPAQARDGSGACVASSHQPPLGPRPVLPADAHPHHLSPSPQSRSANCERGRRGWRSASARCSGGKRRWPRRGRQPSAGRGPGLGCRRPCPEERPRARERKIMGSAATAPASAPARLPRAHSTSGWGRGPACSAAGLLMTSLRGT